MTGSQVSEEVRLAEVRLEVRNRLGFLKVNQAQNELKLEVRLVKG